MIANSRQLFSSDLLIQVVRRAAQFIRTVWTLELQNSVLNLASVNDENCQNAIGRKGHEFDLCQCGVILTRQRDTPASLVTLDKSWDAVAMSDLGFSEFCSSRA